MPTLGWENLDDADQDVLAEAIVADCPPESPFHLEFQPTNRCNVDCFFCSSRVHRDGEALPFERMQAILREGAAANLRSIRLSGGGESLIYPRVRELLALLRELGIALGEVTTNGVPLPALADDLVATGLGVLHISLNEPTADRWGITMRSHERFFDAVLEGARALRAAADRTEHPPVIEIKFMFHRENFALGPEMLRLGRELGADKVMIHNVCGQPPEKRFQPGELDAARAILTDMIAADCAAGQPRLHFWLDEEPALRAHAMAEVARHTPGRFAPSETLATAGSRVRYCAMAWYSATVAATGDVYPCCNFVGLPNKVMGNVLTSSLRDVWTGGAYHAMRREFRWLMLLKGRVEHSRKYHQYLEPGCISETACPFSWGLCSDGFYRRVAEALERDAKFHERLHAHSRDAVLRVAHKARALAGR